jgi:hypothetical protein
MQTFLPYTDYGLSASALDTRRLGKQVIEAAQMLKALETGTGMGAHHPATLAWRGHEASLAQYGQACLDEWRYRHGKDGYAAAGALFAKVLVAVPGPDDLFPHDVAPPPWLTDALKRSHRGHLYRKDPWHYARWEEHADMPLLYPVLADGGWFCYVARVDGGFMPVGDGAKDVTYRTAKAAAGAVGCTYWAA